MAIDITSSAAIDDASASDVYVAIFKSYKTRERANELLAGQQVRAGSSEYS